MQCQECINPLVKLVCLINYLLMSSLLKLAICFTEVQRQRNNSGKNKQIKDENGDDLGNDNLL